MEKKYNQFGMELEPALDKYLLNRYIAIHDISKSDFDAPLTDETLEEMGFVKGLAGRRKWMNGIAIRVSDDNTVYLKNSNSIWKTVGSVKLLIEALKGDEQ